MLGLKKLWLLIVVYGLSCSVFSSLSLCLLRLPRWVCLVGGAFIQLVLLVTLMAFSPSPRESAYQGPLLIISVLWGVGTALNKTGINSEHHALFNESSPCDEHQLFLCVCVF